MENEVLDVTQAAELLKIGRSTLLKLVRENVIPAKKVGRQWRFSRQALLEWLKNGQAKKE
ncbi:MAG: helix-turn-helix domain-containing protein [Dehalobacter sp.]|nr:helix-turn-helix domain-containing protein [Dehalobacter sp.]